MIESRLTGWATFSAPPIDVEAVELALAQPVAPDAQARTIEGRILPYSVQAPRTSFGKPLLFMPGALVMPPDLSRVKLLLDHDRAASVGYALDITQNDAEARARFQVADGPAGDDALAGAGKVDPATGKRSPGRRDGFSVGVDLRVAYEAADGSHIIVEQAVIEEVSLVALPAFTDARVTAVRLSAPPTIPADPPADPQAPPAPPVPPAAPADQPATPAEPTQQEESMKCIQCGHVHADGVTECQARGTFSHGPAFNAQPKGPITLAAQFAAISSAFQANTNAAQVQAALADILPAADVGKGLLTPQQVGEMWTARDTTTPYVDLAFTPKPLTTGLKVQGWAWNVRAKVDDYAGNKTEIPTGPATTKLIEADVKRLAGGWDVDRIYVDMADGTMIEELVRAAIEDYADKSNIRARTALLAAATTIPTVGLGLGAILTAIGAKAVSVGARMNYLTVASDVWAEFSNLTADQVPWWLNAGDGITIGEASGKIGSLNIWADPDLAAGQWLAGDKRAANWWKKDPPVRVTAVDIAHGGVDVAVFGYYAQKVQEPLGVWKGSTKP